MVRRSNYHGEGAFRLVKLSNYVEFGGVKFPGGFGIDVAVFVSPPIHSKVSQVS